MAGPTRSFPGAHVAGPKHRLSGTQRRLPFHPEFGRGLVAIVVPLIVAEVGANKRFDLRGESRAGEKNNEEFHRLKSGLDLRQWNGGRVVFEMSIDEMPPFIGQRKEAGLGHGLLQDVFSLHDFGIRVLVSRRSFRREAIEARWHLHRISRPGDERHIDRGSAGMLGRLAEGIGDEPVIVARGIPQDKLRTGRPIRIPNLNAIAMEFDVIVGLSQANCSFWTKQGWHVRLIKSSFGNRRVTGVTEVNRNRTVDFRNTDEARLR